MENMKLTYSLYFSSYAYIAEYRDILTNFMCLVHVWWTLNLVHNKLNISSLSTNLNPFQRSYTH